MRKLWITAGVFLILLAGAAVAISLWTGSYIRSDSFRRLIANATGGAFGATADFDPLRWTGSSVYSESARLEGKAGGALKHLEAVQLRAGINWRAAFSGVWMVDEISIARLEGEWGAPAKTTGPAVPEKSQSPAGIAALLPHRFELGILKIGKANLAFGGTRVLNSSVSVKPDGTGWLFQGTGGELRMPWPPPLAIANFRVREQGGDFFLMEGNLRLGSSGKIVASGESADGGKIRVTWEDVRAGDVLSGEWRRYLEGTLSGNAQVAFPDRVEGTFHLGDGCVENVPMLGTVADFTGNPSFRRMPLQEAGGNFTCDKGNLDVKKFYAESKGLMRIEGNVRIGKGGELEGHFEIGVTSQTLQWLPGSRERVFKKERNGYLWTDLTVGGTVANPTENLSPRLLTAMGGAVIEKGTNLIKDVPGTAGEGVKDVLDMLRPLIP